jgi:hypothetical protein
LGVSEEFSLYALNFLMSIYSKKNNLIFMIKASHYATKVDYYHLLFLAFSFETPFAFLKTFLFVIMVINGVYDVTVDVE